MQQFINGVQLHSLFVSGYLNLKKNMTAVNDLNVFPVPDGDTGTNMVQTFGTGITAMPETCENVSEYMIKLSKAVLLAARGNSGVIFSQFVHGLCRGFSQKEQIQFSDFSEAFSCATEDSYSAIMTPTEGTMLTVIREAGEFLKENQGKFQGFEDGFCALVEQMKKTLANTPNMLPVLKEAGVVDSGGAGLLCFVEGMYANICGESIEDTADIVNVIPAVTSESNFGADSVLEYGYCTEFILQLMNYKTDIGAFDIEEFKARLSEMGNSIVVVSSDSIVKVHIHTFVPESVLEYGRKFGEFVTVKIENMSVQHSEIQQSKPQKEKVKYAIVTVASGQGIIDYFYSIGANAVINAGQTNNPSVNDFLEAFDSFDAQSIIVLPNNSNIIFTANQAAEMYKGGNVYVIPTKSIVEGYSALSMMNPLCDTAEELVEDMSSGLQNATTAYVTTAVRDAVLNGKQVKKDEYIGLEDKTLVSSGNDRVSTAMALVDGIVEKTPKEVIIVFYGNGVTECEALEFENLLRDKYPANDIGFIEGKQSVYDFIISLE